MTDWTEGDATVLLGRAEERLRELPDGSVDAVVTDPPYGLSREPGIAEVLSHWLAGDDYQHRGGGFMGKSWDSFVPGPSIWREVFRVLKPGGHLLAFAGTRTMDLMSISIRMAGFENRDTISAEGVLRWCYGSGFPKSLDVSKAIDRAAGAEREVVGKGINHDAKVKHGGTWTGGVYAQDQYTGATGPLITAPATDAARQWQGWGTALKPAWEPILVFRKPLSEPNVAANVLAHGTGALNIDACRVAGAKKPGAFSTAPKGGQVYAQDAYTQGDGYAGDGTDPHPEGRWPANAAFSHSSECRPVGTRRATGSTRPGTVRKTALGVMNDDAWTPSPTPRPGYAAADGTETVEAWECAAGCPVAELDRQSGTLTSGFMAAGTEREGLGYRGGLGSRVRNDTIGDTGGASRFFYQAKASASERSAGLPPGERNTHPTVKPLDLMRYLCRLVTPPGGLILDPFAGSGTTGCAALLEGFRFLGIEQDPESVRTAIARIRYWGARGHQVGLGLVDD